MGFVQEYGKGKFRARKRIDGKVVSKSFDTRTEAWAWADDETNGQQVATNISEVRSPHADPVAPNMTVSQFLDGGGFVIIDTRESTQAFTNSIINAHVKPRWGDVMLNDITQRDIQKWVVEDLVNGKRKPRTVHHIYKKFKSIIDSATRQGYRQPSPAWDIVLPRIDEEEMRFLDTAEIATLTTNMHDDFKAFVPLCSYGGLRIGEAFGLRWKCVDLFNGIVKIDEQASEVNGKTVVGVPKTRAGRRPITIPRLVVYALTDHQRALGGKPDPEDYVFGAGAEPVDARSFRRWRWTPAVTASNLTGLTPHDLRHTAVAMWIAAGGSPKEIAALAGHSSVSFTLDRYGHLFPSEGKHLTARLDRLITRGVSK